MRGRPPTWERFLKLAPPSSRIFFHLPLPCVRTRLISVSVSSWLQRPLRRRLAPLLLRGDLGPSPVSGCPSGPTWEGCSGHGQCLLLSI